MSLYDGELSRSGHGYLRSGSDYLKMESHLRSGGGRSWGGEEVGGGAI